MTEYYFTLKNVIIVQHLIFYLVCINESISAAKGSLSNQSQMMLDMTSNLLCNLIHCAVYKLSVLKMNELK